MKKLDRRALMLALQDDLPRETDPKVAAAVARADRDLQRIRDGLRLLAEEDSREPIFESRSSIRRPGLVAACLVVAITTVATATGIVMRGDDGRTSASAPSPDVSPPSGAQEPGGDPANAGKSLATRSLPQLVAGAEHVVIGEVVAIERGRLQAAQELPYVLATVAVERWLKPAGQTSTSTVVFDYDLTPDTHTAYSESRDYLPWQQGDHVLLFLTTDTGTVSEGVVPAGHLAVVGGTQGRYHIIEGHLEAPFTLPDVEQAVRASGSYGG